MVAIYRDANTKVIRLPFYFCICFAFIFFSASSKSYEVDSGTYVSVILKQDFVMIGADSRRTTSSDGEKIASDDTTCKIRILGPNAAFAAMGLGDIRFNKQTIFNPWAAAQAAFTASNGNIAVAAEQWAGGLQEIITSYGITSETAIGIFVEFNLQGPHLRVDRTTSNGSHQFQDIFWPSAQEVYFFRDVAITEDILHSDDAQRIRKNPTISDMTKYGNTLRLLVQRVIERKNAVGDLSVGGEAAVLVIQRGQTARWQYPTAACSEGNR